MFPKVIKSTALMLYQMSGLLCLSTVLLSPACICACSKKLHPYTHSLFNLWAKSICSLLKLQINVTDHNKCVDSNNTTVDTTTAPATKGVLYVHLNQQTLLSSVIYSRLSNKPCNIIMNIEFAMLPFIGWLLTLTDGVIIIRQFPKLAQQVLATVPLRIKNGESFRISIEGRRCDADGKLSPYKKGPAVIAIESQCDIIPFMTFGELRAWPATQWYVNPHQTIDCIIYPKISTVGYTYQDRDRLVHQLRLLAETEKHKWDAANNNATIHP